MANALTFRKVVEERGDPEYFYKFDPKTGFRGKLSRWLWWGLQRLGAIHEREFHAKTFHYTKFHERSVFDLMRKEIDTVVNPRRDRLGLDDYCFVLGDEEFSSLVSFVQKNQQMYAIRERMDINVSIAHGGKVTVYGLDVHIVPYFSGTAILPKVYLGDKMRR